MWASSDARCSAARCSAIESSPALADEVPAKTTHVHSITLEQRSSHLNNKCQKRQLAIMYRPHSHKTHNTQHTHKHTHIHSGKHAGIQTASCQHLVTNCSGGSAVVPGALGPALPRSFLTFFSSFSGRFTHLARPVKPAVSSSLQVTQTEGRVESGGGGGGDGGDRAYTAPKHTHASTP